MSDFVNQIEPLIDKNDILSVERYLKSGGWLTEHKETRALEENIKNYVNRKYAVAVPNGTIAIYLALLSLGIRKGNRVAVPNITMIATINAVIWAGATPVLVDTDENLCMSLNQLEKINNLDAVIFVPLNGRTGAGEEIERWCTNKKVMLIEDSAHALGSSYKRKKCLKLGDLSILSLTPHKIITMGQGGMILTDNKKLYEFILDIKTFNRIKDKSDFHKGFGLNFKITDLQAAIGNSQFKKLEKYIFLKKKILENYKKKNLSGIEILNFEKRETPWFIDFLFESKKLRDIAKKKLILNSIETRVCYPPLSKQKYLSQYSHKNLKNSESIAERILWMPSSVNLKNQEINKIVRILNE